MTEPRRPAALLFDIAVLLALGTALLFTAGWGYAERWFAWFDLGIISLGIPPPYFAMYGYWTLAAHGWWLLLSVAMIIAVWQVLRHLPVAWNDRLVRLRQALLSALGPVLLLALVLFLFWSVYGLGRLTADRNHARASADGFCVLPEVRLVLKDPPSSLSNVLPGTAKDLAEGRWRLLIRSGGVLALIRGQSVDAPDQLPDQLRRPALVVPMSQVALFELIPVPPGCGPD
ncbi:MAG: hypothetical protein N838_16260 [Thiohalocapsa sp. PB-PSB1]|nr:MAG: hypothetical protein N838_16260 [Thiohalocapsa sp. PB-PSB1]